MSKLDKVFIGYDPREDDAYQVARYSLVRRASRHIDVIPIKLEECQKKGLFKRPLSIREGVMYDDISNRPQSTQFSLTRFLIPYLSEKSDQFVLFMDCDQLLQADICELELLIDPKYAVQCTKHVHLTAEENKMDGMKQIPYQRKNWSSFFIYNCKHPSNKKFTLDYFNSTHRDNLHGFKWLEDFEIGELPLFWNHLGGYPKPINGDGIVYPKYDYSVVKNIHYTHGIPTMAGYENCEFSKEWTRELMAYNRTLLEIKKNQNEI